MTDEIQQSPTLAVSHATPAWRCFFCDEVFTERREAAEHFGTEVGCDYPTPACQIKAHEGHLVHYIRKLETELAVWTSESHDMQKAVMDLECSIPQLVRRAEEAGYARGVADMKAQGFCVEPARHADAEERRQRLRDANKGPAKRFSLNDTLHDDAREQSVTCQQPSDEATRNDGQTWEPHS